LHYWYCTVPCSLHFRFTLSSINHVPLLPPNPFLLPPTTLPPPPSHHHHPRTYRIPSPWSVCVNCFLSISRSFVSFRIAGVVDLTCFPIGIEVFLSISKSILFKILRLTGPHAMEAQSQHNPSSALPSLCRSCCRPAGHCKHQIHVTRPWEPAGPRQLHCCCWRIRLNQVASLHCMAVRMRVCWQARRKALRQRPWASCIA